jgi:hypothetical protein
VIIIHPLLTGDEDPDGHDVSVDAQLVLQQHRDAAADRPVVLFGAAHSHALPRVRQNLFQRLARDGVVKVGVERPGEVALLFLAGEVGEGEDADDGAERGPDLRERKRAAAS